MIYPLGTLVKYDPDAKSTEYDACGIVIGYGQVFDNHRTYSSSGHGMSAVQAIYLIEPRDYCQPGTIAVNADSVSLTGQVIELDGKYLASPFGPRPEVADLACPVWTDNIWEAHVFPDENTDYKQSVPETTWWNIVNRGWVGAGEGMFIVKMEDLV